MPQTKKGVKTIKERYGEDFFKRIGKLGGNPLLIAQGKINRVKREATRKDS